MSRCHLFKVHRNFSEPNFACLLQHSTVQAMMQDATTPSWCEQCLEMLQQAAADDDRKAYFGERR